MAPKGKNPNPSGLGRAIINRKVKDAQKQHESGNYTTDVPSSERLKSVTQQRDLDEFFSTAQLADTDFTAEKRNVKIIQQSTNSNQNPYLLTEQEEKKTLQKQEANKQRLRVPRRPPWKKSMTPAEVDKQEKSAFLDWRRGLAQLQEEGNFLLTPFERNLEVWRQLWRVLERSHLVVQIVDARNPLRFRCEDLENYVRDVEGSEGEAGTGKGNRRSLLLINKADLLTPKQRAVWADYFEYTGVKFTFFSAANAVALQEARRLNEEQAIELEDDSDHEDDPAQSDSEEGSGDSDDSEDNYFSAEEDEESHNDDRIRIRSVAELERWLLQMAPDLSDFVDTAGDRPTKLVVGLVGYPNVGKSSTINSLLGEKKVSVSSTPGKTKHFQTIHLSDTIVLCDCPGLVFPQFTTTKADLVCDGVLPIDQMREYTGPVTLLTKRIPREVLEATYGISIRISGADEGGNGQVTAENFLIAHAIARGFMRSSQGNPDEARSARYVLKDYVNGKLLFCHPPAQVPEGEFNKQTHEISLRRVMHKKRAPTTRVGKDADTFVPPTTSNVTASNSHQIGLKTRAIDRAFFGDSLVSPRAFISGSNRHGEAYSRTTLYPHQRGVTSDGTLALNGRQAVPVVGGKKHHKKMKRQKQRSGKGYD